MHKLVIVGVTGLVGKSLVEYIDKSNMVFDFYFVASSNSRGKNLKFKNKVYVILSIDDLPSNLDNNTILINCSSKEIAKELSDRFPQSYLIDNSSQYRMFNNIPLVIPHINTSNFKNCNIISNPNCSTIILCCLLKPLLIYGLKRLVVSTYQAVSGAGKEGISELLNQQNNLEYTKKSVFKYQCANNCFVHDSKKLNNGYSEEEMKMINEVNKIFNRNIPLTCTCVRVPVLRSHCLSVNVEFKKNIDLDNLIIELKNDNNLCVLPFNLEPTSIMSSNKEKVFVGHIRKDLTLKNSYNFFISGDQILRGASYNAYKILEELYKQINE